MPEHDVLAGHIGQAYIIAPGNIACILQNCHDHPGQLRGVLSSVELAEWEGLNLRCAQCQLKECSRLQTSAGVLRSSRHSPLP